MRDTRFRCAIEVHSINQAELAIKQMRRVGLLDALDDFVLLANEAPDRFDPTARKRLASAAGRVAGSLPNRPHGFHEALAQIAWIVRLNCPA